MCLKDLKENVILTIGEIGNLQKREKKLMEIWKQIEIENSLGGLNDRLKLSKESLNFWID